MGQMINLEGDANWKKVDYADKHTIIASDHLSFKLSEMDVLPDVTRKIAKELGKLSKKIIV